MKQKFFFTTILSGLLAAGQSQTDSLESLNLQLDTFDNGSAQSGGFLLDFVTLENSYTVDTAFGDYWSGFAISTMRDDSTSGYSNQYSAITASGADGSSTYAVGYPPYSGNLELKLNSGVTDVSIAWNSISITNSTYAYLSMLNGDGFGKKYGGSSGADPDFLVLHIIEATDSNNLDTMNFYLADFRGDESEDYIVNEWKKVNLSSFDTLSVASRTLRFAFSSTDTAFGYINTPTYFCLDNISFTLLTGLYKPNSTEFAVYNLGHALRIVSQSEADLHIYSINGGLIRQGKLHAGDNVIPVNTQLSGYTFITMTNRNGSAAYKLYYQ
ncbi:MAG: DUF4465 domain-containing protein [Flavobacteriales bacterium]